MSTFPQVAANIRFARKARGLTQERLARAVNVSSRTVVSWEIGATCPSGNNLKRLARVLKREPEWFYEHDEEPVAA